MTEQGSPTDDWSAPEPALMADLQDALADGRRGVVATLAAVEGSAYRRPGAKMVVHEDGLAGAVTAGCLEDEALSLAESVGETGTARLERFDLTADDGWGLGLGCDGVVDLLVEPLDDRFSPVAERYAAGEDGLALAVVDPGDADLAVGDRGYAPDGDLSTVEGLPSWLVDGVADRATDLFDRGASTTVTVGGPSGPVRVFVDPVLAPPELYVFGSGTDAAPMSELAAKAGFRVTVVAFRGGRAAPDRFPHADRVASASAPRVADELDLGADAYAVVMSHNFVDDRLAVESLLETPVPYVGVMGPTSRFERLLDEIEGNRELSAEDRERLYGPVGLDLGGGSPYRIATSVVSETLAVRHDRAPRHLRDRESPIHGRPGGE